MSYLGGVKEHSLLEKWAWNAVQLAISSYLVADEPSLRWCWKMNFRFCLGPSGSLLLFFSHKKTIEQRRKPDGCRTLNTTGRGVNCCLLHVLIASVFSLCQKKIPRVCISRIASENFRKNRTVGILMWRFPKSWGYPQIITFNGIIHYEACILEP